VVEVKRPVIELSADELNRLSEKYDISPDKLGGIIEELNEKELI